MAAVLTVFISCAGIGVWVSGALADGACPSKGCVMLIQIDGLEPKDVTPQTTPFLWALAHPDAADQAVLQQHPDWAASAPYATMLNSLGDKRSGFAWQAARGVMQASTAPNTVSLLTGGYPEQTGVPSDAFYNASVVHQSDQSSPITGYSMESQLHRLGVVENSRDNSTEVTSLSANDPIGGFQSLFQMVSPETGGAGLKSAAFIGDPALGPLTIGGGNITYSWQPASFVDPAAKPTDPPPAPSTDQAPPVLCPIPRDPGAVATLDPSNPPGPQHTQAAQAGCVAPDNQVLNGPANTGNKGSAINVLKTAASPGSPGYPAFTYIELAELGAIKRLSGDLDGSSGTPSTDPASLNPATPMSVPHALHETDAALAMFFGHVTGAQGLAEPGLAAAFKNTIVMVVGDHGYEQTLPDKRVPSPSAQPSDPTTVSNDLEKFVAGFDSHVPGFGPNTFKLVPQGTAATVYCGASNCPAKGAAAPTDSYRAALAELKKALDPASAAQPNGGLVNQACKNWPTVSSPGTSDCIQEVVYTRPQLAPAGHLGDVLGGGPAGADGKYDANGSNVAGKYNCAPYAILAPEDLNFAREGGVPPPPRQPPCSGWHFDHNAIVSDNEIQLPSGVSGDLVVVLKPGWSAGKIVPTTDELTGSGDSLTNPYLGSDGGPRNRPIAAIINGSATGTGVAVQQVPASGDGRYPVMKNDPTLDAFEPKCPLTVPTDNVQFPTDAVAQANAAGSESLNNPDATGYLCQAEIVDFAPTIASILGVNMPGPQIQGRLLREAFTPTSTLPAPCSDCLNKTTTTFFGSGPISSLDPSKPEAMIASHTATFAFGAQPGPPQVKFWCRFDSSSNADWYRCGRQGTDVDTATGRYRSETLGSPRSAGVAAGKRTGTPLAIGEHTFDVCAEAKSETPRYDPSDSRTSPKDAQSMTGFDKTCSEHTFTHFRVVPFFDYDGLLRNLGAFVTDGGGHPVARNALLVDRHGMTEAVRGAAKRKAMLDHLDVRADFGKPFNRVQLTLYRTIKLRKACPKNTFKFRGTCLDTLAKFPPFTITRGPVDLLFKVPAHFSGIRRPDHVGISVQELKFLDSPSHLDACRKNPSRMLGPRTHQEVYCHFKPIGKLTGNIVPINAATLLHRRKG